MQRAPLRYRLPHFTLSSYAAMETLKSQLAALSLSFIVDTAGHFLFNDNTLIQFNSIIAVSKWPLNSQGRSQGFESFVYLQLSIPQEELIFIYLQLLL